MDDRRPNPESGTVRTPVLILTLVAGLIPIGLAIYYFNASRQPSPAPTEAAPESSPPVAATTSRPQAPTEPTAETAPPAEPAETSPAPIATRRPSPPCGVRRPVRLILPPVTGASRRLTAPAEVVLALRA